jgi:hypothetical protein
MAAAALETDTLADEIQEVQAFLDFLDRVARHYPPPSNRKVRL